MNNIIEKINKLRKERNAIILAHYYQESTIQDIADFLGDSLALAQAAKTTNADVIVFCGVHFMAETAKILNPEKIVLVPDLNAGCSLADSAPPDKFAKWVADHPDHIVISYINCSAQVKAMSDIICTSSNAVKIVNSVPLDKKICFAPDKYLADYVRKQTKRDMVIWDGTCQVHETFSETELVKLMIKYPKAKVLAHPECPDNLLAYAHFIGSTTGIINKATNSNDNEFIILTETGIIHQLKKKNPDKIFYTVPDLSGCNCNNCPYMKLNTPEKILAALETLEPQIHLSEDIIKKALIPLERMLEIV